MLFFFATQRWVILALLDGNQMQTLQWKLELLEHWGEQPVHVCVDWSLRVPLKGPSYLHMGTLIHKAS